VSVLLYSRNARHVRAAAERDHQRIVAHEPPIDVHGPARQVNVPRPAGDQRGAAAREQLRNGTHGQPLPDGELVQPNALDEAVAAVHDRHASLATGAPAQPERGHETRVSSTQYQYIPRFTCCHRNLRELDETARGNVTRAYERGADGVSGRAV
jgi:hypothetical protein